MQTKFIQENLLFTKNLNLCRKLIERSVMFVQSRTNSVQNKKQILDYLSTVWNMEDDAKLFYNQSAGSLLYLLEKISEKKENSLLLKFKISTIKEHPLFQLLYKLDQIATVVKGSRKTKPLAIYRKLEWSGFRVLPLPKNKKWKRETLNCDISEIWLTWNQLQSINSKLLTDAELKLLRGEKVFPSNYLQLLGLFYQQVGKENPQILIESLQVTHLDKALYNKLSNRMQLYFFFSGEETVGRGNLSILFMSFRQKLDKGLKAILESPEGVWFAPKRKNLVQYSNNWLYTEKMFPLVRPILSGLKKASINTSHVFEYYQEYKKQYYMDSQNILPRNPLESKKLLLEPALNEIIEDSHFSRIKAFWNFGKLPQAGLALYTEKDLTERELDLEYQEIPDFENGVDDPYILAEQLAGFLNPVSPEYIDQSGSIGALFLDPIVFEKVIKLLSIIPLN